MKNPCLSANKKIGLMLVCALLAISSINAVFAQSNTVVRAVASSSQPRIGDALTVNITISTVQNLFGVDVTLSWNTTVLSVTNAKSLLGVETHPEGVLHESGIDTLLVAEDAASQETGQYTLTATSVGSASAFSGNGIIATVTFNVTGTGPTGLSVESELSDKPATGQTSNFIEHTDTADAVDAVVPEFPSIIIVGFLIAVATTALIVSKKHLNRTTKP
jgi:hypothetical protein